MDHDATSAIVLAGGHSRRFGRDKARVLWRGRSLLDHVLGNLPADCAGIILVVRKDQLNDEWPASRNETPVRVVADDASLPPGPMRGLITGLEAIETDRAWAVACDTPAVPESFLAGLGHAPDALALVPQWNERLQPLCALYTRPIALQLRDCVQRGEESLIDALQTLDIRIFEEGACRELDPGGHAFLNINRPDDLADLETNIPA